jgi:transcriptional regulator with XRE-family HTH domain
VVEQSAAAVFGRQLRALRERNGWTLAAVARRLAGVGVSWHPATVAKVETGKRGVSLDDALALCEAANVTLADLLGSEDVAFGGRTLTGEHVRLRIGGDPMTEPEITAYLDGFAHGLQRIIAEQPPSELIAWSNDIREHGVPSSEEEP